MKFQLTASQGGWLHTVVIPIPEIFISTHSLTRRLTYISYSFGNWKVFQLTASQGGWHTQVHLPHLCQHFNSQPHKEADSSKVASVGYYMVFQLTASQGGWRLRSVQNRSKRWNFNSQPHKEADAVWKRRNRWWSISTHSLTRRLTSYTCNRQGWHLFQLTASQGGWRHTTVGSPSKKHFNSQPHKEADRA